MPYLLDPETESHVRALRRLNYSINMIVADCKRQNMEVSRTGVHNIINNVGRRRQAKLQGQNFKQKSRRPVRTARLVEEVRGETEKRNPQTVSNLANLHGCSRRTIHRVLHNDLGQIRRKKPKTHQLNQIQMSQRFAACSLLLFEELRPERFEFIVTLDESWLFLPNNSGETEFCYVGENEIVPDDWCYEKHESFRAKTMAVGILTGRGPCPLIFVPQKVKVNAEFYKNHVLRPLVEKFLPKLYPNELDKVWIHHDAAPSHTAQSTIEYMKKVTELTGIRLINKDLIPVKSPDGSPLDFYGFGYLKHKLKIAAAETIEDLQICAKRIWRDITQEDILRTFNSWQQRYQLIVRQRGGHIENIRQLHRRSLASINH